MAWHRINKKLIQKSLRRAGIEERVSTQSILDKVKIFLKENFGAKVLKEVEPLFIKNGSLVIRVTSSLWSLAIKEKEGHLFKYLKAKEIKRIRFVV